MGPFWKKFRKLSSKDTDHKKAELLTQVMKLIDAQSLHSSGTESGTHKCHFLELIITGEA